MPEIPCTIAPSQSTYNVEVALNVATLFDNTVIINSNDQFGTLIITSNSSYVTFGASLAPTTATYQNIITTDTSYVVPISVNVTGSYVGSVAATLNWTVYDDQNNVTCAGNFNVAITITSPQVTTCPLALNVNPIVAFDLLPENTGTLVPRMLLDRSPALIGNTDITFTLPEGETVIEFDTQDTITGVTWDDSNVGSDPKTLVASLNMDVFTDQYLDIKLRYTIPINQTADTISSSLYASSTFVEPEFVCTMQTFDIYLKVLVGGTSGGFQATARIETGVLCETANVYDNSNYGADTNHDLADFDAFRKILITKPDGKLYTMASVAPYDEEISPASSNVLLYPIAVTDGGIYTVKLTTVPTYASGGIYSQDDTVYYGGKFYQSLVNTNNVEPENGVAWEDYWVEITEDEIPSPYYSTQYYVQWCDITNCKHELQQSVFCSSKAICSQSICDNKCFQNYLKLEVVERMLAEAETLQWYTKMTELYNYANQLCDCSNGC